MKVDEIDEVLRGQACAKKHRVYITLDPYYNDKWHLMMDGQNPRDALSREGSLECVLSALALHYKSFSH